MSESVEPFDPYYHWLGIPPEEQPPNRYRLLGIQLLEENQAVIQNAADRQMAHLRTFQSGPHAALSQRVLNEVAAARVCLLSPDKKAEYDQSLQGYQEADIRVGPPTPPMDVDPGQLPQPAASMVDSVDVPRALPAARRAPKRRNNTAAIIALVVCALVSVGVVIAIVAFWPKGSGPEGATRLVLNWPVADRQAATLLIDGQLVDLSTATRTTDEQLEFILPVGTHEYQITRPGTDGPGGQFEITRNQTVEIDIRLPPLMGPERSRSADLVLSWPSPSREGRVLEIDGKVYDLTEENVSADSQYVRVTLLRAPYRVKITHDGKTEFDQVVAAGARRPTIVSREGTIVLRWSSKNRDGVTIVIDEIPLDLAADHVQDDGQLVSVVAKPGRRIMEIRRGDATLFRQHISVVAGKQAQISVDAMLERLMPRLVLDWPLADRADAVLKIDGVEQTIPSGDDADDSQVIIDLEPGQYDVTITRHGYEDFSRNVRISSTAYRARVSMTPIPAMTTDPEELQRLREEFVKTYTQYPEFRTWSDETNPASKRSALARLLATMSNAASNKERYSAAQFVAYDQTYRIAFEQGDLSTADSIARRMRSLSAINQEELASRQNELWDAAVAKVDLDAAQLYFRIAIAAGRELKDEEKAVLSGRIVASEEVVSDYAAVERMVDQFEAIKLLDEAAAAQLRADVLLRAAKSAELDPGGTVQLAKKMLDLVPKLLKLATNEALVKADNLVDAANLSRRKVMTDRRSTASLAPRVEEIRVSAKEMQDRIDFHRRVVDAQEAAAAGKASATQHKVLGLWLLEQSEFEEATTHLRLSSDAVLVAIAKPLPDTRTELTDLADAIEAESRKTRYSKSTQAALLAYSHHVRQLALSRPDTDPSDGSEMRVGVESWNRLRKGQWRRLVDIVSIDELRKVATANTWTVTDDGTFENTESGIQRLELPIQPEGSYSIRCVCQTSFPGDANVNLPLGERAVMFTLGTITGIQLIDGKPVGASNHPARLDPAEFRFRMRNPVQVEIQVEYWPAETQTNNQKRATGGVDWVQVGVLVDGRPLGARGPATRFSVSPEYALSKGALGFTSAAHLRVSDIHLKRQ